MALLSLPTNPLRGYLNQQRLKSDVYRMDHIGWSPHFKRSAVVCKTDRPPCFMFLDGKQQPEYQSIFSRGDNTYGSRFYPFHRDSSVCVYIARTDKTFVVANEEESNGLSKS